MINIVKQSGKETTYITEFVVDTEDDIFNLPVHPNTAKGSSAIVIETGDVYLLSGDNVWKKI